MCAALLPCSGENRLDRGPGETPLAERSMLGYTSALLPRESALLIGCSS